MSVPAETDQALTELVESDADLFGDSRPTCRGVDVREFQRFSFRGRAKAVILPPQGRLGEEPQECEVLTTDLSRGGLSLLNRKQLFPGQQIILVLHDENRLVEVCWCCRVWSGLYSAGCRFVGVPPTPASES
jgi:PilZ domain